eukprot:14787947-Ditylum_brightwellii.AAC.1
MEKLKTSIKNVKLSTYVGENIVNMNQEICANLLHYIANIWAITHVYEKTTTYLNATNNFHEDEIDASTIVTYTQLLDVTSHKYKELRGSGMRTPKVPSKKQHDEPDLSTA